MSISDEGMLVVRSLRQAFESYGGPGSSVNATANPFFILLTGQFDLAKASDLVLRNLEQFHTHKANVAKEEAARHLKKAAQELALAQAEAEQQKDPLA